MSTEDVKTESQPYNSHKDQINADWQTNYCVKKKILNTNIHLNRYITTLEQDGD